MTSLHCEVRGGFFACGWARNAICKVIKMLVSFFLLGIASAEKSESMGKYRIGHSNQCFYNLA